MTLERLAKVADVIWIVVGLVVVVALAAVAVARRNRSPQSSVESFRRQIDALGPAARRSVVDQVQQSAAGRDADGDDPVAGEAEGGTPGGTDEGGPRGA